MINRREIIGGAAAATAALAAPSIGSAQGRSVLRFVPQADLTLLDPVQSTAIVTRNHGMMVYDTLYGLDESLTPQPQMAAGHLVESDGRVWSITLRPDQRWHDGTPVLARDVVASFERWAQIDPFGRDLRNATDELTAPSDTVLRFRLKRPFPLLPTVFAKPSAFCAIMPERLARTPVAQQVTEVVGSGPFRFVPGERVVGSMAVYERNAAYVPRPDGVPSFTAGPKIAYLDRVEWRTMPDSSTAAAALQTGEMDWWEQPLADLIPLLRRSASLRVEVKDRFGCAAMLRMNCLVPPFDNPAIRRALLGGIVQSDYMSAVMGEDRSLWSDGVGFFLPGSPAANDAGLEAITGRRDLDKVKRDLAAAGYKNERVVLMVPSDFPSLNAMSEVAQEYLRGVGINLDYQVGDWGTVLQRLSNRAPVERGGWSLYANFIAGVTATTPATHSFVRGLGAAGPYGWPTSPRIEQLRTEFLEAATPAVQAGICRDIQVQAFQDVPYLPVGRWVQPTAFNRSVSGILDGFPIFWNVKKG